MNILHIILDLVNYLFSFKESPSYFVDKLNSINVIGNDFTKQLDIYLGG